MRVTGETAIRLAEKYGLPIHKEADADEGFRADIPLEDAQRILRDGNPELIYTEAEPEMIAAVTQEIATGTPGALLLDTPDEGGAQ